ncbi:bifunctional 2',3'-cyclic-nucleotide 2'-phosphodiesterase/3'-nucleotidase [Mangrovicoccus algicola]|uniref:Bifunctional 2',3'-cyclic-nucleotide 2'-phosphodiesterase/3'-nucleotidase n=1 Tax=Mangrovicoccus algicola TaxID=2771008 RepID=A0A8J6Z719_9RHOB|nr:bifunctional 2',3'-cyclic-nucleotide 2'-phosphodiesterase/3'-nucleotidase [Mangrovicoccus algicola]
MTQSPSPPPIAGAPRISLRLLGLTDLHAHLLGHDYETGRAQPGTGLARLATLIARLRAEAPACLLFDNGDTLQGTALGDWAAEAAAEGRAHPMIRALNQLGVDAATPGNHDFNYGLPFLDAAARQARYPLVCANVLTRRGAVPAADATLLPPWVILERDLPDQSGARHRLRIGVIGALPPQILDWDRRILADRVQLRGIREAVAGHLPGMRAAGADLVLVLSHSGPGADSDEPMLEQAATALARLPGVDAIIAGHSHAVFPPPGAPPGADRVHGTPLVQPGFWGSHLGVIDLDLVPAPGGGWQVAGARSRALPPEEPDGTPLPEDPGILAAARPAHRATQAWLDRPVGRSRTRLHSYLSLAGPDAAQAVVAEAQGAALAALIADTDHAGLPLLSAVSPFKSGGRAGPDFYTDVPEGPLSLRHVADLYAYPNSLCGRVITGAELCEWLERAASIFLQIRPGRRCQPLVPPRQPGYEFDTLFGARYAIDLSGPPRYDAASGVLADPSARRIRDLRIDGRPVAVQDRMVVATNNYRLGGGGNYPGPAAGPVIAETSQALRGILAAHLAERPAAPLADPPWHFAAIPGASAVLETSPRVRDLPADLARLRLADLGDTPEGFARFELPFTGAPGFSGRPLAKQSAR